MDKVYGILNYMTGDNLFTHQLPRASREMLPVLLEQHPQLKDIDASPVNEENWAEYRAKWIEQYGNSLEVLPADKNLHQVIDPITEACDMVGEDRVISILIP